ncbi:MAG TPA: hypothetical protein VF159_12275 [Gemmatimonadaceae bacterium]
MKRVIWFVIAVLGITACSELSSAPRRPSQRTPGQRATDLVTCRSGYVIAYRSDGTAYCAPDSTSTMTTTSTTTASTAAP